GLHGVGSAVVNALSSWLEVKIYRDGFIYEQRFENGGKDIGASTRKQKTNKTGTRIHFKPDETIFSSTDFNKEIIAERLRESAFLIKGLEIELIDHRNGEKETFTYPDGLKSFVSYLNEGKDVIHEVISFEGTQDDFELDFAFQFNDGFAENMISCVNDVRTEG